MKIALVTMLLLVTPLALHAHTEDEESSTTAPPGVTTSITFRFGEPEYQALVALLYAALSDGMVVGFATDKCPPYWEPYDKAPNRFLMGAGDWYNVEEVGGTHEGHSHEAGTLGPDHESNLDPVTVEESGTSQTKVVVYPHTHLVGIEDGGSLPPFVSLLFCKPHVH